MTPANEQPVELVYPRLDRPESAIRERWTDIGLSLDAAREEIAQDPANKRDPNAILALQAAVIQHLDRVRSIPLPHPHLDAVREALPTDEPMPAEEFQRERDGMHERDAAVVGFLRGLGAETSTLRRLGTSMGDRWARKASERWTVRKAQAELPGVEPVAEWMAWVKNDEWQGRLARYLAGALWAGEVRAEVERDRQRETALVRHPTGLIQTTAMGRLFGGKVVGGDVLVEPPKGIALALPFNEELSVAARGGGVVSLRQVLDPVGTQIHLGTLVLYQDAGSRDEGSFETYGPDTVIDVIGAPKYENRSGGRVYMRFHPKTRQLVERYMGEVFPGMRVRRVGHMEARGGDPLVDEIRDLRDGKRQFYAHARLIVAELRNNYTQIPRALCRVCSDHVPIGLGIAALVRQNALAYLRDGKSIEAELLAWLDACGLDSAAGSRKEGRDYWRRVIDLLAQVADEAKLGRMTVAGSGRDAVLTLDPDDTLKAAYRPLLESANGHAKARKQARVVNARGKK